jgi:hypothetical protein
VEADVGSTSGTLYFDVNADHNSEMTLNSTGLSIGVQAPSANLQVNGNALITQQLIVGGVSNTSNSNLHIHGTLAYSIQSVGAGGNTISGHSLVLADTSSGNVALSLPSAANMMGQQLTIKRTSDLNSLFISGVGDTFDGITTVEFGSGNRTSLQFLSNGSAWYVMSNSENSTLQEIGSDNLLLFWKLNETSGNVISDSSSTGHYSGNLENSHLFSGNSIAGASGNALFMDDPGDRATYSANQLGDSGYTWALWTKYPQASTGANANLTYEPQISGKAGFMWASGNAAEHKAAFHQLSDSSYVYANVPGSLAANTWHHLASSWDGSTLNLYLNGVWQSSNTTASSWMGAANLHLTNPNLHSGANVGHDDLRYYSKALTRGQIQALYQAGNP